MSARRWNQAMAAFGAALALAAFAPPCLAEGPGAAAAAPAAPAALADAPASPARPDSTLDGYLAGLADSTHAYFKGDALGFDSTGVDSLDRLYRAHPELAPEAPRGEYDDRRHGSENSPLMRINRLEGVVTAARVQVGGTQKGPGALSVMAGRSFGLHEGRYALGWSRTIGDDKRALALHLSTYRSTDHLDALQVEPDPLIAGPRLRPRGDELRFRREGWRARALLRTGWLAAEAAYRDEQAHTLPYHAQFHDYCVTGVPADRAADPRTVRALGGALAVGGDPVVGMFKAGYEHAGFGGAFTFNRVRVDAARVLRIGRFGLLALQAEWSAADSGAPAQERSYAGGASALQGYPAAALGGRQMYLGRATLLMGPDVLATAHIPHPAWLPLSLAIFAETGAVPDLQPGDGLSPRKPRGDAWASDVGVGLWWRPGLPDPSAFLKFSAALPVGPRADHRVRWTLSWNRLLDWF